LLGVGCGHFGIGIDGRDETADFISWCCAWFWKGERNAEETTKIDEQIQINEQDNGI
jgi:hypothetical protein